MSDRSNSTINRTNIRGNVENLKNAQIHNTISGKKVNATVQITTNITLPIHLSHINHLSLAPHQSQTHENLVRKQINPTHEKKKRIRETNTIF